MMQAAAALAFVALIGWFVVGHPATDLANALWATSPAPWENVIGFYYPDKSDHTHGTQTQNSGTLAQCREWAQVTIAASLDPSGDYSSYTCAIGCSNPKDISTCRTQVQ